ncbi:MAG: sigma-70 family RNA polymerase sigma factor [Chitinophagaceae bacterium]|nr:MAG: sigma-70 family RNA polymerase sigma factor [Chitinophagaceae bacterium]
MAKRSAGGRMGCRRHSVARTMTVLPKFFFRSRATPAPECAFNLATMQEMLNGCRKGRTSAQKAFYERFARPMFAVCRRYLKTDACAEEVLHNGFLKFFTTLDRFTYESDAATAAWLKRIMINECLMQLRRTQSFLQVGLEEVAETATASETLDGFAAAEIHAAILQLPTGYRTVFNLYALEQYSHKEISTLLGISEGTSKSQLSKARALLQQTLIRNNPEYALRRTR